jgi:PDZ domain-containing secreted protein
MLQGDVIKEINHNPVKNLKDFKKILEEIKSGELIQIFIKRKNVGFLVFGITR